MSELKIYEISDALINALDNIHVDEETGEIVGTEELQAVQMSAEAKIVSTGKYLAMRRVTLEGMKQAAKNIQSRIKTEERRQAWLESQMISAMQTMDSKLIEAPDVAIQVRQNPESVQIFDEAQIPADFIKAKMETSIDKTAIKAALKSGKDVPGAKLTRTQKLVIK
jgi:ATP-dependent exoDNAse (exonuclease V) beta subunit